ncbi:MAG: alpha/beta fold hydrolase [Sphingomicrobium sp.]
MNRPILILASALLLLGSCSKPAAQAPVPSAATADPAFDAANPASNLVFTIPVGAGAMNAMMYTAAGAGPHPTLLLLHGFPGNEQNLDLAQATRRAGWNVLTQHYRGSWGSKGAFSFAGAAEDARAALAFLKRPDNITRYRIDAKHIAIAGHSMGGMMAADAAADDPSVAGLFLIDAWDISADAKGLATPEGAKAWHDEVVTDLPALSGTDEAALTAELRARGSRFDLAKRVLAYGNRPLDIIGAERGGGAPNAAVLKAVRTSVNPGATGATWPTDHSFNDRRIALSERLVTWLGKLRK